MDIGNFKEKIIKLGSNIIYAIKNNSRIIIIVFPGNLSLNKLGAEKDKILQ